MADFSGKVFIDDLFIDIQGNYRFCGVFSLNWFWILGFSYLFNKYQREIRSRSPNKKISVSQYFTRFLVSSVLQEDHKLPQFPNSVTGYPRLQWELEIHKSLNYYCNWSSSSFIYMAPSTFKTFSYCRLYQILQLCREEEKNEKIFYSYLCEHPPNTCMFFQLQISYVINTIFYFCMEKGQIFFYIFAKHLTHRKMQVGNIRDFIFLLF